MEPNTISRRDFIKTASITGAGFWLGLSSKGYAAKGASFSEVKNITPWILVEPGGAITIFNTRPELGQGTFQSVPALIAEEFEVSLEKITIRQSDGQSELGNMQRAGGSASIRTAYLELRKIGAAAREMFIKAASTKWRVNAESCYAEDGRIIHRPTKRAFSYGELAADAAQIEIPKEPKLKDPKDFKILGKAGKRPDIKIKTCGKAEFGIDVEVPDMLYATVMHSPVLGGTLKSFDETETLKVPGVVKVGEVERVVGKYSYIGVAVIANSYWAALQGRKALKVEWDTKGFETFNTAEYEEKLRELSKEEGLLDKTTGSVQTLSLMPDNVLEAFYETPMVAHHAMEPINCLAHIQGDGVEIWTSTQVPTSVVGNGPKDLHNHIGIAPDKIKFHTPFIGGGFGRRLYLDFIIEGVNVAKLVDRPVKTMWSREETTQLGPFRPMTFSKLRGGFSDDGKLMSFEHKVISPSCVDSLQPNWDITKVDGVMMEGIGEQKYEIPNLKTSYVRADYHVPIAAWRSVTSSTLSFPHECFIDELAHKANKDPLDFRLELLTEQSDLKRVLLKLRQLSNWDKPMPKGQGRGVAQWEFFAGLCAHVVEVSYGADKKIKVDKVIAVIDLGEVVNPDNVKAQVEGAIIMALGAAVKPGITLENGRVVQTNFHNSPLMRIYEIPQIEVHILAEGGKVKGVGEPGLPPFTPALCNAIFAATGKRIRKIPFDLASVAV